MGLEHIVLLTSIFGNCLTLHFRNILESPSVQIVESADYIASSAIGIAKLSWQAAQETGKKTKGFEELINNLENVKPDVFLHMVKLSNEDWAARCILNRAKDQILGCAFIERSKNSPMKTPPNWDGSVVGPAKFTFRAQAGR